MPVTVGLLSDSHSQWERTKRAIAALQAAGATIFVHCGDVESAQVLDQLAGLDAHIVWGNCDWNRGALTRYAQDLGIAVHGDAGELTVDGKRIAFTHGHMADHLRAAVAAGTDYVVHGHTHERCDVTQAGTRVINPGALHRAKPFTVAAMTPATGEFRSIVIQE